MTTIIHYKKVLLSIPAILCSVAIFASVTSYTNRATWTGAIGGASFNEDFSSFLMDTDFRLMAVSANGFSVQQTGVDQAFRNFIDTAPYTFSDNNGTTHLNAFVDLDAPTNIALTFDQPIDAWFADFYGHCTGEMIMIELVPLMGASTTLNVCPNSNFGFTLDPGDSPIQQVIIKGVGNGFAGPGEGFGVDDISGRFQSATVPTMGEWGLIILALLVLSFGTVFMMRRKTAMAGAGEASMSQSTGVPFDRASFGKMLAVVMIGLVVVFAVSVLVFGYEMTNADVPGALIAGPIAAYLLHLLFGEKE